MNILKLLAANAETSAPISAMTLYEIISSLGLTANLKLCLDAGDSASYNPSIQTAKWLDTSGNGYDFFRGSSAVGDAGEPTFNGVAGNLSINEYWSFDGADYFTYDAANEVWMQNLHKNNAQYSCIAVLQTPDILTNSSSLFGTNGGNPSTSRVGVSLRLNTSEQMQLTLLNGSSGLRASVAVSNSLTVGNPQIVGVSFDEASAVSGGVTFLESDGSTTEAAPFNYTSPSVNNATFTMTIASGGNGNTTLLNGAKLWCIALWDTALTPSQLEYLHLQLAERFGL